ncbi:MAG: transposase [Candidatus Aminicenantales bacterium]
MKRQRRQFSADWKAKIALEAIKGQRTIQEIASHYEIHPSLVTHWKKQLLEGASLRVAAYLPPSRHPLGIPHPELPRLRPPRLPATAA